MRSETVKCKARRAGAVDARLVQAERKANTLLASLARLSETTRVAEAEQRVIDELCATIEWIRNAEPRSLVGAAAKLRVLLHPDLGIAAASLPDEERAPLRQVLGVIERDSSARQEKRPASWQAA